MREGLVGLSHAVHVVLALERGTLLRLCVEQLACQAIGHVLFAALAAELDQPADGERAGSRCRYFDRDLVGGATDTAGLHLEHRGQCLDRVLERLDRRRARATRQRLECVVDDLLGGRLLAVEHHLVDDLLDELRVVKRVGLDRPTTCCSTAGHYLAFTPYCERAFLRSETPAASRVPRTTL